MKKMVFDKLQSLLEGTLGFLGGTVASWVTNVITFVVLLIVGMFAGKISKWLLKKVIKATRLGVLLKQGLQDVSLTIIKWVIYIVFLQFALVELGIPFLSLWLKEGLLVIPSLVGLILILSLGFTVGKSLKNGVEQIEGKNWNNLGQLLFVFFIYASVIIALNLFFNSVVVIASETIDTIFVVITALAGATLAWNYKDVVMKR
jgi:hypothetical protein